MDIRDGENVAKGRQKKKTLKRKGGGTMVLKKMKGVEEHE